MSTSENTDFLIDNFITGKMSPEEMQLFVKDMQKDAVLADEVRLQQSIVDAIKEQRRLELKSRLDSIKVGSSYGSYLSAGISTAVVIFGIWYFTSDFSIMENTTTDPVIQEEVEIISTEKSIEELIASEEENTETPLNKSLAESDLPSDILSSDINSKSDQIEGFSSNKKSSTFKDENVANQPNIIQPQIPDPPGDSGITISDMSDNSLDLGKGTPRSVGKVEVEIKASNEYNFHYQYFNNKLYLYGDFGKSPYELIELNTEKSKDLYMYFEGKYFALKTNQLDITKLTPIRDKIIVKGLDNLRL